MLEITISNSALLVSVAAALSPAVEAAPESAVAVDAGVLLTQPAKIVPKKQAANRPETIRLYFIFSSQFETLFLF